MSKLYFRYGAMNCGKTTQLLQVAHNYEEKNKKVIIIKASIDSEGKDNIVSRLGVARKVDMLLEKNEKINIENYENISCILVDEAQFLSENQVTELWKISKLKNIPVICYGLKTDFKTNSFEGSKRLFELSDELEELITICSCGKRAKFNSRKCDGKYLTDGKQVLIDGTSNIEYESLCGKCYIKKVLGK